MTNPENFADHRKVMIRFSQIAGALGSAYVFTHDKKYAEALLPHLNAWFIDRETMMNPNLLYGQAIMG
nr:alginate lyase family protein [Maribacter luteus]